MNEIIAKIRDQATGRLKGLAKQCLGLCVENGLLITPHDQEETLFRFIQGISDHFENLLQHNEAEDNDDPYTDFENLSLILEDELDVLVAVEGMVAAARNIHLTEFIRFNTRLHSVLEDQSLDESSNPLDPEQLFDSFKEAVRPLGLDSVQCMTVFRIFNEFVFGNLQIVLAEANQLMIDLGILPELGMPGSAASMRRGRSSKRRAAPSPDSETDDLANFGLENQVEVADSGAADDNTELFSMMQELMHTPAAQDANLTAANSPPTPTPEFVLPQQLQGEEVPTSHIADVTQNKTVEVVDQSQLSSMLANIQMNLATMAQTGTDASVVGPGAGQNIQHALGDMLEEQQEEGTINAVDRGSSDVIKLVELLYEAIWNDDAVPIPIKELIGRTQITVIQVALSDQDFFNSEDHPARALLNDFARAGIGWTEVDDLQTDSLYQTIDEMVKKILHDYQGQIDFFANMVKEFRAYRAREFARGRRLEQRIKHTRQGDLRRRFAKKLVNQRIEERVLGRELNPFVSNLLSTMFHEFMVLLVLKEGPGSNAWKQAINTIDVLLWSVQPHEQKGDRDRLEIINPRLLNNLKRAFTIAQVNPEKIDEVLEELKNVQLDSFVEESEELLPLDALMQSESQSGSSPAGVPRDEEPEPEESVHADEILEDDDEYMQRVDSYGVGTWFEFDVNAGQRIRCKLAAKINAIDKLIFVNRQGVKVVEKTKMGLAVELKYKSAQVISDGLLFSRALESVIGDLRETQNQRQDTSSLEAT